MLRYLLMLCCILCASSQLQAAALSTEQLDTIELDHVLEQFNGVQSNLTLAEILNGQAGTFVPLSGHYVKGFGGEREVWLRLTLHSTGTKLRYLRILPPIIDYIDVYQFYGDQWQKSQAGDELLFNQRPIFDRSFIFPIQLKDGNNTIYIHLRHNGLFNAYFTLYTANHLLHTQIIESLLLGLYFGSLIALFLINFLHWFTLREKLFAEFSIYLLIRIICFSAVNGLIFQLLLPENPQLVRIITQLSSCLIAASIAPLLVRVFNMSSIYPYLAYFCYALGGVALLLTISVWSGHFTNVAGLLTPISILIALAGLITAITQLKRKSPLGWLHTITALLIFFSLSATAISGVGIHISLFSDLYGSQISSLVVSLVLHFSIAQRVSELKQAQTASAKAARLAAAAAEQERLARREQSDFVAMLFHEIKTPLAEIASATTVLEHLDNGANSETGDRYDAIHYAVERLNLLIEHNLARDRQGLEDIHLTKRPVDLEDLSISVLNTFQRTHINRLKLSCSSDLPLALADPEFLRVALANLLDNALKYSPEFSIIDIQILANKDELQLCIIDHGPGMDQLTMARAFDRYWRGNTYTTGAGLGLYLVRRIAQAHGGSITVHSVLGQGCRFTLSLPRIL